MARREQRREDLLRDAVALKPRIQLRAPAPPLPNETVFAGWRDDSLSLYFDEDPAYHFNSAGELRRGFIDHCLVKAERGRLVSMQRQRSEDEVTLARRELNDQQCADLLTTIGRHCDALQAALEAGTCTLVGEFPPSSGGLERLKAWLAARPPLRAARQPRVD